MDAFPRHTGPCMSRHTLYAPCPRGLEAALVDELRALGAAEVRPGSAGVAFGADLEGAYRVCLWSRLASRVLLQLARFPAPDPDALYAAARALPWHQQLGPDQTLAVDCSGSAPWLRDSRFGALKLKDAVVDAVRDHYGERPSVDARRPDLRVALHLARGRATVSLDLAGDSLHRRGYRLEGARAPLKENLAAGILVLAGWPEVAARGGALFDPMCGSGTLLIEAALLAGDIAPGLDRDYFGFFGWLGHDGGLWARLLAEAEGRRAAGLARIPPIFGRDADGRAVAAARENIERAGLSGRITVEKGELTSAGLPPGLPPGLLVSNLPYGERIGEVQALTPLYRALGRQLARHYDVWAAALFVADTPLAQALGLKADASHPLYNGALRCRLLAFRHPAEAVDAQRLAGMEMFANRLRKNLKQLGRWARREGVECYRLYDADMPEYAVAVDLYTEADSGRRWAHVQEYAPPKSIDPDKAAQRLQDALVAVAEVLEVPESSVILKVRQRARGGSQYGRMDEARLELVVREGPARLRVNLSDYLDTGLFLDHRITRRMVAELARGRRFLNLFCYTGAATVQAALAGAMTTTSVDLSATYLDWARANLELNGLQAGAEHRFIKVDCVEWLAQTRERFGVIFLDPPTFSNSKAMAADFDVQRDHVRLIRACLRLLDEDGVLLFSNNRRDFRLDRDGLGDLEIEEISRATLPEDFKRNPKIHHCWVIRTRMKAEG